jgi:hypothetical protein
MELSSVFFHTAILPVLRSLFGAPCMRAVSLLVELLCLGQFCCSMLPIRPALCQDKRHLLQPDQQPEKQRCFAPAEFATLHP